MTTENELWSELEEMGEDTVRARFAGGAYGRFGNRRTLVEEWLRRQEVSRSDFSNREQISIARSAKNAAWIAAIAAIISMIIATASIVGLL